MVNYVKITISGLQYNDADNINVSSKISESNAISSANISFLNTAGRHKSDFNINDEVKIYAGSVNPPTTQIFTGILKDISLKGKEINETLKLSASDYSSRLNDFTVEPRLFINEPVGSIVVKIMQDYVEGISYSGVQMDPRVIERIIFNQVPVFDAIKQLADYDDYIFYVDINKDLHFEPAGSVSSNVTFNSGNVIKSEFTKTDQELSNDIWVYGDSYYMGRQDSFTPSGGSVFNLSYKPHNTAVYVAGSLQKGDIYATSGTDYYVDFDQKNIVFISGAYFGNHIPGSGTVGSPVEVNYDRDVPIVVRDQDYDSIQSYGRRVKIIEDQNIKSVSMAQDILNANLNLYKDPRLEGELSLYNIYTLNPGNTCVVNLPHENINNQTYDIVEVNYEFNPKNIYGETTTEIKVSQHIKDIVDVIKKIMLSIKSIEASMRTDENFTSYKFHVGSCAAEVSSWIFEVRQLGSSFVLDHNKLGRLGSLSPQNYLGFCGTDYSTYRSGGTWL